VNNHQVIEEGNEEAAIEAFLVAHEEHTPEVEIQRGTWSIYCHCKRCGEIHTYEVDNEARQQALGFPPWQEDKKTHRRKMRTLLTKCIADSSLRHMFCPLGSTFRLGSGKGENRIGHHVSK
jgi:hypothetical protein